MRPGPTCPEGSQWLIVLKSGKTRRREFVAYFCYNAESIFWTEGYSSKASAKKAIESILKNGPGAEVVDKSAD